MMRRTTTPAPPRPSGGAASGPSPTACGPGRSSTRYRGGAYERAVRYGADATVELVDSSTLADSFRRACGNEGPTLVFDPVWGEPLVAALEAAAPRARIIQLGQAAGANALVPSALIRGKDLDVLGYTNFNVPFEVLAEGYRQLGEHVRQGRIVLEIENVSLEDGAVSYTHLTLPIYSV